MLPRIRERIANEVRQGGGNPFDQLNFGAENDNNNGNNNRNNAAGAQNQALGPNEQQAPNNPQPVRPADLYLGCSTRVRRELLRINEWDRLIALKDVWTKQLAEAPTQAELDEENNGQQGEGGEAGNVGNNNNNNNNNINNNNDQMIPANINLMEFLNGTGNDASNNENSDHDIREIMDHNIKKHRFRPAYYKVQFLNPTYSANLDLLKLFHKRHAGNPKLAAQQFCRYWDLKLEYFGLEQLCKPLTLMALSSQDKACLHNGCMQLSRDDHGRTVLSLLPSLLTMEQANGPKPMETDINKNDAGEQGEASNLVCPHLVRALWYLIFRALQDKGETNLVILLLGQDKDDLFCKTILHCTSMLREALPFNVVALHYLDGPGMSTLDEDESNAGGGGQNASNNHNNENFLWGARQPENQEDMHGFGGLEQVAEWGGAVEMLELPQDNLPLHHQGNQEEHQQRRLLEKSKASLEHLEDRVGRNVRLRLRFHNLFELQLEELRNGSDQEESEQDKCDKNDPFGVLRKRLAQFGIPNIPLNSDGTLIMHNPIDSSSKRFFFTRPEYTLSSNLISPTPKDILLGKGRPYQEHPGNIAMNDVIDKYRDEYTSCKTRTEKTAMSQNILETIRNQGGRFLIKKSKDDDLWVVATDTKARDKVAHSFRMPRKFLKDAIREKKMKEDQEAQGGNDAATGNEQQQQKAQGPSNGQQAVQAGLSNTVPPVATV